jgi:hypothetical protein
MHKLDAYIRHHTYIHQNQMYSRHVAQIVRYDTIYDQQKLIFCLIFKCTFSLELVGCYKTFFETLFTLALCTNTFLVHSNLSE